MEFDEVKIVMANLAICYRFFDMLDDKVKPFPGTRGDELGSSPDGRYDKV